jgi:hypothetical protein
MVSDGAENDAIVIESTAVDTAPDSKKRLFEL